MERKKWRQHFWRYLRQYRFVGVLLFCFCVIFGMIFFLYRLDLAPIGYASLLCCILFFLLFTWHFHRFYRASRQREQLFENLSLMEESLPTSHSPIEDDYQLLLQELYRIYRKALTDWQNARTDSIDYYTTWVHQIKTPISVMQLLLQKEDTLLNRQLADELFRIEQYVEMVLHYFRLDGNANDLVLQQCDLDGIIRKAIRKYAPSFIRKHIQLQYEPVSTTVLTDEKWILFILEQLLSNAIKYTEQGSVTISVTPQQVLEIKDTGIGIAAEDLPRIFEKGYTGYNGRSHSKSTGLGLYLCSMAAGRLCHTLSARSQVGVGSVFSLDLHRESLEAE